MSTLFQEIDGEKVMIKECLQQQLMDLETLQSIYMEDKELEIHDHGVHADINEFVNSDSADVVPNRLDFTLNLFDGKNKTEINFDLPSTFPYTKPSVYVVSTKLSREESRCFNEDLYKLLAEKTDKHCLFETIEWIKDNMEKYVKGRETDESETKIISNNTKISYSRFWIYSHHIYNKLKRREIVNLAASLNLTGFSLPGKPGVICIEGELRSCEEWWSAIRSMNWQKINVIQRDALDNETDRYFNNFEEKIFQKSNVKAGDKHMDMGEFYKFLEQNNCGHMFKTYFGFDGKCEK